MSRPPASRLLLALAFIAFVSLGLPDTLLGVAWTSVCVTFHRPIDALIELLVAGMSGYLLTSFFGGTLVARVGVGRLLAGSCALVTIGLTLYAVSPSWIGLCLAALIGGLGAGAIDSGVNSFAATAFSARVVNWLHACWGIGATTGPLVMTAAIATHRGWRFGYGTIGVVMFAMTLLFIATIRMWRLPGDVPLEHAAPAPSATVLEAVKRSTVQWQALFYLLYGGIEASVGLWTFSLLTESRGVGVATAGTVVSSYWGSILLGRVLFGQLAGHIPAERVVQIGLGGATLGSLVLLWPGSPHMLTYLAIAIVGLSLAPVFPTVIALTPARVGERFAAHSVGFQVSAASCGIAMIPGLIGVAARRSSLEVMPWVVLVALLCVSFLNAAIVRRESARSSEPVHA